VASVTRDGAAYEMSFALGHPTGGIKKLGPARGSGTKVFFQPDPTIFPRIEFNPDTLRERLEVISYIHRGVRVVFEDQVNDQKHTFQHDQGLKDFLAKILTQRSAKPVHPEPFACEKDNGFRMELVLQWTESTDEVLRSYVNGIPTGSGGTHENGLRAGLAKAVRNYMETHELTPKNLTITAEDVREGLTGLLSVFVAEPQFQGQTKDRLNNPEVQSQVDSTVRPALEQWLHQNGSVATSVVDRVIQAARAREASRAAVAQVSRKSASNSRLTLPGKLSDCLSKRADDSELFIVEGDSAGGSAKQGRDRNHQAILPLRGKVLNAEQANMAKILDNKELSDIVTALGCGMGKHFDPGKLRYRRIILLMDADSDGMHISTLLLTFFYRHLRPLVEAGYIYIAQPPLYRIDIGKETHWAVDDKHRQRILAKAGSKKAEITRFKGLGEMPAKTLWQTTLNPKNRRLLRVSIADALATDRVISELMGKDASARYTFIMDRAEEAEELDL
jgi:DNA gyrase subunit B/topoisomerase-4 subunit B